MKIYITWNEFDIAVKHLLMMGWVGITEELFESVQQLKTLLNLEHITLTNEELKHCNHCPVNAEKAKEMANKTILIK